MGNRSRQFPQLRNAEAVVVLVGGDELLFLEEGFVFFDGAENFLLGESR